jgi:cell division septation protein DedD
VRLWAIPAVPLFLSGCGLPPAVTIASYAADGVSYLVTGKTVTDHGISAATGQDCAVIGHLIEGKPVCGASERGKEVPLATGKASMRSEAKASEPQGHLDQRVSSAKDRYVAVGSYLDPANAARAASRYARFNAAILQVFVNGRQFNRVIVGPLSPSEATALRSRLAAQGSENLRRNG